MSAYAEQILTTMDYLMEEMEKRLDNDEEVLVDDINKMTIAAFKRCAENFEITETTVRDKCTRQMGITTAEFYQLIKDSMVRKDLLYMIISHSKRTDTSQDIIKGLDHNFRN